MEELCDLMPLAQVGNSDAHVLTTIGQGCTEFHGRTAKELRRALIDQSTKAYKGKGLDGFAVLGSYLPHFLLRKMGWTIWNDFPSRPNRIVRMSRALSGLRPQTLVNVEYIIQD